MDNKEIKLPSIVKDKLPSKAQEIYREVFDRVWDEHAAIGETQRELAAHDAAMLRVSQQFEIKHPG